MTKGNSGASGVHVIGGIRRGRVAGCTRALTAVFVAALLIPPAKIDAANGPATPVGDVALHADGTLRGRVIDDADQPAADYRGALPVIFVQGQTIVAAATATPDGRFAVSELPDGLYQVIVEHTAGLSSHYCRVWSPRRAPPAAVTELRVPRTAGIVRGQRPAPVPSFQQAATWAGIIGGAIAAPVIYYNTLVENRLPASR